MGEVKAGEAYIEITAKQSSGVKKTLADTKKQIQEISSSLKTMGIALGALGGAITGPLALGVKTFTSLGDQIAKAARRTGLTVEAMSQLKFAAEQSGAGIAELEISLRTMQRGLFDASRGTGELQVVLKELGLSANDFQGLNTEQQFKLFADALSKVDDEGARAAMAMKVFGRSGTAMLPLIADGAKGIEAFQNEANKAGITMSSKTAVGAEKLTDALNKLNWQFDALKIAIGEAVGEELENITPKIGEVIKSAMAWVRENKELIVTLGKVGLALVGLGGTMAGAGFAIDGITKSLKALKAMGPLLKAAFTGPGGWLTLLVIGLGVVIKNFDNIKNKMAEIMDEATGLKHVDMDEEYKAFEARQKKRQAEREAVRKKEDAYAMSQARRRNQETAQFFTQVGSKLISTFGPGFKALFAEREKGSTLPTQGKFGPRAQELSDLTRMKQIITAQGMPELPSSEKFRMGTFSGMAAARNLSAQTPKVFNLMLDATKQNVKWNEMTAKTIGEALRQRTVYG